MTTAQQNTDEMNLPNETTLEAIIELASGGGTSFTTVEELMADLYTDE